MSSLRIGTRGSALALVQAGRIKESLERAHAGLTVELIAIKTSGDQWAESPLSSIGGKGVFIKEIEEALLDSRVDLAVHSYKDLPTDSAPGLTVAAVPLREDPRDCVVSRFGEQLLELPRGSVVGTGSLRRQAQVKSLKKSVRVKDMRGNLDTRLHKVMDGDVDAIVVALAGVRRLGRENDVSEILATDLMMPAPGQGCLALQIREDDAATRALISPLNHALSERAAQAERSFLAALGGGCLVPIGANAREENGKLILDGLVISPDGKQKIRGRREGDPGQAQALGKTLADFFIGEGVKSILNPPPEKPETTPAI